MSTTSSRSPFNRARWSPDDAREVITALRRSGKSVRAFAADHGLDAQRLHAWRRRIDGAEPQPSFRELVVRAPETPPVSPRDLFEIVLGPRCVVRVPASFDAEALRRLIAVLTESGAC